MKKLIIVMILLMSIGFCNLDPVKVSAENFSLSKDVSALKEDKKELQGEINSLRVWKTVDDVLLGVLTVLWILK